MSSHGDSDYTCSLSEESLAKARKELGEDPKTRLVEVKTLMKRLEKVPGLKAKLNFTFLLAFLRARKFDQERAFQTVKKYYEAKRDNPDLYDDLKPSRVRHVIDDGIIELLEHRDNDGCRVIVFRLGRWDPTRYSVMELPKALFLILSTILEEEETQVNGVHFISNMEDFAWKQGSHLTPAHIKRMTSMVQEMLPLRIPRMDYMHEPTFFDVIFAIIKQFLKEKLIKRTFLNGGNFDILHKTMSPDHLPTDLKGKLPMFNNKAFVDDLFASDAKFEEDNKFGYVNMKVEKTDQVSRSGDVGMQGLGGTFKKLEI